MHVRAGQLLPKEIRHHLAELRRLLKAGNVPTFRNDFQPRTADKALEIPCHGQRSERVLFTPQQQSGRLQFAGGSNGEKSAQ